MKLNVHDRLMTLTILPKEGSLTNLKLIRKARENLSFDDEELKLMNLREEEVDGNIVTKWDEVDKKTKKPLVLEKEIDLGETVTGLIVDTLLRLDKEEKLSEDMLSIYEKFIE